MRSYLLLIITLVLTALGASAQDLEHTQFYANSMYLNPALAGDFGSPELVFSYRNQWPGISADFVTATAAYDQPLKSTSGGFAAMIHSDRSASSIMSATSFGGAYSQKLRISRSWNMSLGLQGNFTNEYLDGGKLTFNDQILQGVGFVWPTNEIIDIQPINYVDFSSGVLFYDKKFFIGYAAHHMNTPNKSFIYGNSHLPAKHTLHGGASLPIMNRYGKTAFYLRPTLLYRHQGPFDQLNLGVMATLDNVAWGLQYRGIINSTFRDAVQFVFMFSNDSFTMGYSYDLTVSDIGINALGAHELNFKIIMPEIDRKEKYTVPPCHYGF
jgi:type IX secretion system PorP/SprF family membrane protein